jgi:hypothetical protein
MVLLLLFSMTFVQASQIQDDEEILKVKAAFILNLVRFVQWPWDNRQKSNKALTLCFYQNNFLHQAIETIRHKKVHKKAILLKTIKNSTITERCDVILVPPELLVTFVKNHQVDDLFKSITITDLSQEVDNLQSLENKVIFRLKRDDTRLRFEVNKTAANLLGVEIGSELLKLGIIVSDKKSMDRTQRNSL